MAPFAPPGALPGETSDWPSGAKALRNSDCVPVTHFNQVSLGGGCAPIAVIEGTPAGRGGGIAPWPVVQRGVDAFIGRAACGTADNGCHRRHVTRRTLRHISHLPPLESPLVKQSRKDGPRFAVLQPGEMFSCANLQSPAGIVFCAAMQSPVSCLPVPRCSPRNCASRAG